MSADDEMLQILGAFAAVNLCIIHSRDRRQLLIFKTIHKYHKGLPHWYDFVLKRPPAFIPNASNTAAFLQASGSCVQAVVRHNKMFIKEPTFRVNSHKLMIHKHVWSQKSSCFFWLDLMTSLKELVTYNPVKKCFSPSWFLRLLHICHLIYFKSSHKSQY